MAVSKMRMLILATYGGLLLASAGCAGTPKLPIANPWSFHKDESADLDRYGPTIDQRIESTRSLGVQAPRMSAEERSRTSRELRLRVTNEPNPRLRAAVVQALGHFNTPDAIAGLKTAMTDGNSRVRLAACEAWRTLKSPESVSSLAEILASDTDVGVRIAAAKAMGDFSGSPVMLHALQAGLDDQDPALQHETIVALRRISGRDYGGDIAAWRTYVAGGEPTAPAKASVASRVKGWFF